MRSTSDQRFSIPFSWAASRTCSCVETLGRHRAHRLSTWPSLLRARSKAPGAHDGPKNSLNNLPYLHCFFGKKPRFLPVLMNAMAAARVDAPDSFKSNFQLLNFSCRPTPPFPQTNHTNNTYKCCRIQQNKLWCSVDFRSDRSLSWHESQPRPMHIFRSRSLHTSQTLDYMDWEERRYFSSGSRFADSLRCGKNRCTRKTSYCRAMNP